MSNELRVTMRHVHACNLCSRGAANKLKALGFSRTEIMDILKNGIPVSQAARLNDAQMDMLIKKAYELEARDKGEV